MDSDGAVEAARREWRATGFCWGARDCLLSPADFALALTGVDPAPDLRGAYGDEAGAQEIIDRAGGVVALMHDRLTGAGWVMVDRACDAQRGDIVCVDVAGSETGGICLGGRSLLRLERGAVEARFDVIAAWRAK